MRPYCLRPFRFMDIPILTPLLGLVYKIGLKLDRSLTRSIRLPRPVVSVGNIASGGRGKTPFVNYIAKGLQARGFDPVVLTRGYGRRDRNLRVWLLPGSKKNFSPDTCGDEALEIFFRSKVPVLVGPKRFQNALFYLRGRQGAEKIVFILDDGFQHWDLHRDFDLVLLRETDYKAALLPLGFLREEPKSLSRAHLVLEDMKDFQKKTFLKGPLPKDKDPIVLTTRVRDPHYQRFFKENCKNPFFLELRDHAELGEIVKNLVRFECDVPVVIGAKEATKIFPYGELQSFFEEGQAKKEIAPKKTFHFFFADYELWVNDPDTFWSRLMSVIYT